MARLAPGTASSEIFICIGSQPELDFGGKRNPDGQGFAAFWSGYFGDGCRGKDPRDSKYRANDQPTNKDAVSVKTTTSTIKKAEKMNTEITFYQRFEADILAGKKTITIRNEDEKRLCR